MFVSMGDRGWAANNNHGGFGIYKGEGQEGYTTPALNHLAERSAVGEIS